MYLGVYEVDGNPEELVAAYDRVMSEMPEEQIGMHLCAIREGGITIYDTCPTKDDFEAFSTGAQFRAALDAAGLPRPRRIEGFALHAARVGAAMAAD